jgi:non-ribosomal peptide synthetase-like protein
VPPPVEDAGISPALHGMVLILARGARDMLLWAPGIALLVALIWGLGIGSDAALAWLASPALSAAGLAMLVALVPGMVALDLLIAALWCRWAGRDVVGVHSRWSLTTLRIVLATEAVRAAGRWLSGTLLWPRWLRLAGMRIGTDSEVSTVIDVIPGTVSIGEGSFLADGIYLGGPRVHRGTVSVAETSIGARTFIGNHAVLPAGVALADDLLVGVCTVADDRVMRAGSSYFGHPPMRLPRREIVRVDRRLTHEPGWARRLSRWSWELARLGLPLAPLLVAIGWYEALVAASGTFSRPAFVLGAMPLAGMAAAAALYACTLALKWALIGRARPGQHPLWSCWCSRWDFLYVAWGQWCRGTLATLEGTLLLAPFLRAMGGRIGRRVVLGGGFAQIVDPDMLHLGDDATVAGNFQAHSFEDRVLKLGPVHVERGATVGPGAVLFHGAIVGAGARVAAHGVVMKREHLRPGRHYQGVPVREQ